MNHFFIFRGPTSEGFYLAIVAAQNLNDATGYLPEQKDREGEWELWKELENSYTSESGLIAHDDQPYE